MAFILNNATEAELATAIEDNLFDYFRALASVPGGALVEAESFSMHDGCQPAPLFRGVWRTRLAPRQMDAAIAQAQDWFRGRGSDFAAWWFNSRQPPELLERLEAHGFRLDYSSPAMALDNHVLGETLVLPEGLTIAEALDERTLADFSAVIYESYRHYHMSLEAASAFEMSTRALGARQAPWRLYVGYMDGKPVATNLAFNGGGVTGLFCIATVPEYRGRGIGAAVTLKPLYDARAAGYRYAVLFASKLGLSVYERAGFRKLGINVGRYMWNAD